jgi:histidinol-phosphate phosphatase family protein
MNTSNIMGTDSMHAVYTMRVWYASGMEKALAHSRPRPGILLDRDGTIISDSGYPGKPEHVKLLPGAPEAIASFNAAGIPVAVVTNQGGVAYGYHTIDDVERTHFYIAKCLAAYEAHVDAYFYCPYHPKGIIRAFARHSEDRKPRPGMAFAAQDALGLDLTLSWVVGDRPEDMELAERIGATGVYVGPGDPPVPGIVAFPSLADAAPFLLEKIALA